MEVGQTVYLKPIRLSNAYRRSKDVKEDEIEKIGRVYVTLKRRGQFYINSRLEKTDFTSNYKLFLSKEELNLEMEKEDLESRIKNKFASFKLLNLSIDKLREIAKIIDC